MSDIVFCSRMSMLSIAMNKLPQNLSAKTTNIYYLMVSYGPGIQVRLSCVPLAQGPS